jgi:hypothetical protein
MITSLTILQKKKLFNFWLTIKNFQLNFLSKDQKNLKEKLFICKL